MEMAVPTLGGYWLDRRLGTLPLFVCLGALVGVAIAAWQFYQNCKGTDPKEKLKGIFAYRQDVICGEIDGIECRKTFSTVQAAILSAIVFVAAESILPVGWFFSRNPAGVIAGAAAAGICWFAGLLAMIASERLRAAGHVMGFLVAGTAIRIGIPLMAVVLALFSGRPLDDAAFLYYLIGFYPITLVAEIVLALPGRVDGSDSAN